MTRTRGGHWPRIIAFENILRAAHRAARGKRRVAAVASFLADREQRALDLRRQLDAGSWTPGQPTTFAIREPKRRTISAAPFADRVVHHALIDVLEPDLDRRMIRHSYACRRGRGTHAALDHAQRQLRSHDWFLKLDVAACFASLEHSIVLSTLERVIRGERTLALCRRIVQSSGSRPGQEQGSVRGLPIGNLTSQWFANLVLDRLDHHLLEQVRVSGYLRYMDDFVVFGDSRAELRDVLVEIESFLTTSLRLSLKARGTILSPASEGLPFLGWRLFRGTRRLRPANLRRSITRLRRRRWELRQGRIDVESYTAGVRAICAHLDQGCTLALQRSLFREFGEDVEVELPRAPP